MIFNRITKADIVDDADPRVTPPSAARVASLGEYADTEHSIMTASVVVFIRVLDVAEAVVAAGTASITVYVKDKSSGFWLKTDAAHAALAVNQVLFVPIPAVQSDVDVFVQLTSITGAGATHVVYGIAPGGPTAPDISISSVNLNIAAGAGGLATETTLAALNAKTDGPWSSYTSTVREKTATVKGTAGDLKSFVVNLATDAGATLYVQAHDAAAATPVSTGTIKFVLGPIIPGDVKVIDLEKMTFAAGIKLAESTTEDTYTAPGTDKTLWHARYV